MSFLSLGVVIFLSFRSGEFSVSGEEVIEEIDIFEGNENRLTFEEVSNDTNCSVQI